MYVVFTILIQDGERQRYEFRPQIIEDGLSDKEITIIGDEIITVEYSTDELSNGFYWCSSMEIAGRNDGYKEIPNKETYDLIKSILLY